MLNHKRADVPAAMSSLASPTATWTTWLETSLAGAAVPDGGHGRASALLLLLVEPLSHGSQSGGFSEWAAIGEPSLCVRAPTVSLQSTSCGLEEFTHRRGAGSQPSPQGTSQTQTAPEIGDTNRGSGLSC
jgi:hypothetical protein